MLLEKKSHKYLRKSDKLQRRVLKISNNCAGAEEVNNLETPFFAIITAKDPWRLRKRNSVIAACDLNWPNAADNHWWASIGAQSWISAISWSCAGSMERRNTIGFQVSSTVAPLSEGRLCFYAQANLPKSCNSKALHLAAFDVNAVKLLNRNFSTNVAAAYTVLYWYWMPTAVTGKHVAGCMPP